MARPAELLDSCKRKYGDPFTLRLSGIGALVIIADPEAIREIFTSDDAHLRAGEGNAPLAPILGAESMLLLDGERHLRHRRLLLPPFHGDRMRAYADIIRGIAEDATADWPVGPVLSMHPYLQTISIEVILRAVFGLREDERTAAFRDAIRRYIHYLSGVLIYLPVLQRDFGPASPWGKFRRVIDELFGFLRAEMAARRGRDEHGDDIMSLLLLARDEDGEPLTESELLDELLTLLAAGHETTATALVWALQHVLRDPAVEQRLVAEIEGAGADASPDDLTRLPYLDAVCKEALRLYPVVPVVGRRTQGTVEIAGRAYPGGVSLAPCMYLTHRNPDVYDWPLRFIPDRFLEKQHAPYEFLPFGGGIRRCVGASFAVYEMKIVLATILSRFRLRNAGREAIRPVRRHVTFYPKGGTRVTVERRVW